MRVRRHLIASRPNVVNLFDLVSGVHAERWLLIRSGHAASRAREAPLICKRMSPARLGCGSLVGMMQAADLRNGCDRTGAHWLNRPRDRSVLPQRQMRAGLFIVFEVGFENPAQARFIQYDDVVQALASNRADQSFDVRVLPGRLRRSQNLSDTEPLCCFRELLAVTSVAIPQQVPRGAIPWESF
jgi:hypothetical protein